VAGGGVVMPLSPPFYVAANENPAEVKMTTLLSAYVERVISQFGQPVKAPWEDCW